jgi:hypothetical protein
MKMSTEGIEDIVNKLRRMERELRGKAIESALNAGADVLVRGWQNEIAESHPGTGAMEKAVAKTPVRYSGYVASIEVYPMGTDRTHKITHAQKAYILHYGRNPNKAGKKAIKGDKFVTKAEHAVRAEAEAAMQKAFNEFVDGKE